MTKTVSIIVGIVTHFTPSQSILSNFVPYNTGHEGSGNSSSNC
ncbi:MAG: hypothetical protein YK1312THETA_2970002 [Marine Group I thaumarchaeote]|nr:MAG: hypothetical protein YK1312THETA_2970002 [Marine Group I thaumarchaeote]